MLNPRFEKVYKRTAIVAGNASTPFFGTLHSPQCLRIRKRRGPLYAFEGCFLSVLSGKINCELLFFLSKGVDDDGFVFGFYASTLLCERAGLTHTDSIFRLDIP